MAFREGSYNSMYNAFGLNIRGSSINDFIGKTGVPEDKRQN